jgi:mycofactocin glycosyltransferase
MTTSLPLPVGFGLATDPDTKQLSDSMLFGGSPARVLRLTAAGRLAWRELAAGTVRTVGGAVLARRMTDSGLAHPRPPALTEPPDVTVVVPARDRSDLLDECLAGLGQTYPVVVVDDGSEHPQPVADVAARHGARLVRRESNGGAGAARNTGLAEVTTALVAFVDSDCVPVAGWVEALAAHLSDPLVGAAAPRVQPAELPVTSASKFSAAAGALDLGDREARVQPMSRVAYVPTAALVVRRAALLSVASLAFPSRDGQVFDEALRCGEDVDLVWRLHEAGWRVRYDPSVQIGHHEPTTWAALLGRRFRYGQSAAPLARRHPRSIAPLVLHPWPTVAVAGLLARRPALAAAGFALSVLTVRRRLAAAGAPTAGTTTAMARAAGQTFLGLGRYGTQFASPVLLAVVAAPGRPPVSWRRTAALALLVAPPLAAWARQRPPVSARAFVAGRVLDDVCYGAGVWTGAYRCRSLAALRPLVAWRPLHVDPPTNPAPTQSPATQSSATRPAAEPSAEQRNVP